MKYDSKKLEELISIWWSMRDNIRHASNGYDRSAPTHRDAVSSRQWDSSSTVIDDALDRSTSSIIGDGMNELSYQQRAMIIWVHCGSRKVSMIVDSLNQDQQQQALRTGMDELARYVQSKGITL